MGVTLLAVLTAALLLPGIIAIRTFFAMAKTAEVEPSSPPLSSADGIALVGSASLIVHVVYAGALSVVSCLPAWTPLPLADPYLMFAADRGGLRSPQQSFAMFAGLLSLCVTAYLGGRLAGAHASRIAGDKFLYGPLAELIRKGDGSGRFIVAYVLGKIGADGRQIGYQGTVVDLIRDADRFPAKVILRDVSMFYLVLRSGGPERREMEGTIDMLAVSKDDWHNIAFRVFQLEE
ncbi:hypothetical protein ASG29_14175 [Sphingomonas sp. Leaf412]|uniref:hypothetical protein n=1 Tax=Sphingomonas sp. Leaf412 TaxID=1736370 RepID=UPI0006F21CB8|nr:hypothetical protein [Sphingomonas sp. Leaf412]KQT32833.1 hypothetical protein ASG29_14175 [Sphingomonas sp. Leaf412]